MSTLTRDPKVKELADAVFAAERKHRTLYGYALGQGTGHIAWAKSDEAYEEFCAAVWALADRDR